MPYGKLIERAKAYYQANGADIEPLNDEKLKIANIFGNAIISKGVIKVVWALSYINTIHYATFMNGLAPETPFIDPNNHPDIYSTIQEKREQVKKYFTTALQNLVVPGSPDIEPEPISEDINPSCQPFIKEEKYWITNEICSCALFFLLMHELAHNECPIKMPEHEEFGNTILTEAEKDIAKSIEDWCDTEAFNKFKCEIIDKNSGNAKYEKIGMQIALLFLAIKSLHQKKFDGDEHPESYKRIRNVMVPINQDDDTSWCILVSILSLEISFIKEIKIDQSVVHDTFKSVVDHLLDLLEKYDIEECRGKKS